jgi:hypothetical protein
VATVLGLAMKLTADSSGMAAGLSEAEKQIKNLRKSTDGIVSLFDKFAGSSDAAAEAQANAARDILLLTSAFKEGLVDAQGFAAALNEIEQEAKASAAVFAEGAATTAKYATDQERMAAAAASLDQQLAAGAITKETHARAMDDITGASAAAAAAEKAHAAALREGEAITAKYATEEERTAAAVAKLDKQLKDGVISVETHARAIADVTGANAAAKKAEDEHAAAIKRAADITKANLSPTQIYDQEITELEAHLKAGRISQETFNSAVQNAAAKFAKAEVAAAKYDAVADDAGAGAALKFNELSGVLSVIPGPIGNVAGRLSGLASAGEGLSKVFSGGLSAGLGSIGTTVAGLINPFTAGLAAVAAFGAGAVALSRSLVDLEDRVEKLGRLATQLGVSFEFVQTLEEAGNRTDISVQQLQSSFARLQDTLAGGDANAKKAENALNNLGVSLEAFGALSEQQQIELIAERLDTIEDPALRSATAIDLFGKSGVQLLPFFRELGGAQNDIERLGAAISDLDKQRLADLGSGFDALAVATRGLGQELTLPFVGLGEGVSKAFAEIVGGVNAILAPIGDVLEPVFTSIGQVIEFFGVILGGLGRQIGALLAPVGEFAQALGLVGDGINEGLVEVTRWLVDTSVAATEFIASWSPLSLIADGITYLVEQVQGVGSNFLESFQPVIDILGRIGTVFQAVFENIGTWVGEGLGRVTEIVGAAVDTFLEFTGLGSVISGVASAITAAFNGIWEGIRAVIAGVGGFIERVVSFAENWLGIKADVEDNPIEVGVDMSEPSLAATMFAKEIGDAATAAAEFGDAGFQAALQYQKALEDIAILLEEGELTQEEAKRAVEQQQAAFEQNIASLEAQAEAQRKAADEAEKAAQKQADAAVKAAEADRKRAEAFMQSQGIIESKAATDAQETLLAISRQIEETQDAIVEARASGDREAEASLIRQLGLLDQAQAAAQDQVDFGFTAADATAAIEKLRGDIEASLASAVDLGPLGQQAATQFADTLAELEADLQLQLINPEQFEEAAAEARKIFDERVKQAQEVAKLEEQYAEKRAAMDEARLEALSRVSQEPLQVTDLRTSEGASQFLAMATGRSDPAVEEYRKQLAELRKIQQGIDRIGGTVEIVGAG